MSCTKDVALFYIPRTSVEEVDGKHVLVIWFPAGINRPYSVPENVASKASKEYFYVRSGTSSIVAKGDVLDELRELACTKPLDEILEQMDLFVGPTAVSLLLTSVKGSCWFQNITAIADRN